jgi:hypothetical protein
MPKATCARWSRCPSLRDLQQEFQANGGGANGATAWQYHVTMSIRGQPYVAFKGSPGDIGVGVRAGREAQKVKMLSQPLPARQ